MNVEILELASFEIEDAREHYNLQQLNLGDAFKNDVRRAINNIVYSPKLYPKVEDQIRRCLLHRFPYSIFYTIETEDDMIVILSVAHQRRKPYYWIQDRVKA
jgi:plasmid stabilization system protein ParE